MVKNIKENIFQLCRDGWSCPGRSSCIYLLKLDKLVLVDVADKLYKDELLSDLKQLNVKPEDVEIVLLTHGHKDHCENLDMFANAKVYLSKDFGIVSDRWHQTEEAKKIYDSNKIEFEYIEENVDISDISNMKAIKSNEHSKDHIAYSYGNILFSGDQPLPISFVDYDILCPGHTHKGRGGIREE